MSKAHDNKPEKQTETEQKQPQDGKPKPRCFVIMPFSSPDGYEPGHFDRVYTHIIQPACDKAHVVPERTDDTFESGYILSKMLTMLTEYELAICDMSAINANVFYELGIRHAFDMPVTLIKDEKSRRMFDVQGFSSIEYDSSLRIDKVSVAVEKIAQALIDTYTKHDEIVNSIKPFIGMKVAQKPESTTISSETGLILKQLDIISKSLQLNQSSLLGNQSDVLYFKHTIGTNLIKQFLAEYLQVKTQQYYIPTTPSFEEVIKFFNENNLSNIQRSIQGLLISEASLLRGILNNRDVLNRIVVEKQSIILGFLDKMH